MAEEKSLHIFIFYQVSEGGEGATTGSFRPDTQAAAETKYNMEGKFKHKHTAQNILNVPPSFKSVSKTMKVHQGSTPFSNPPLNKFMLIILLLSVLVFFSVFIQRSYIPSLLVYK